MTVNDEQAPIIHISGTVTDKDYISAMRETGLRFFLKYILVFIAFNAVITLALDFFTFYRDINTGYITFAEFLSIWAHGLANPRIIGPVLFLLALYAAYLLVYRPYRACRQIRELHPDGVHWTYDFYDDHLDYISESTASTQTVHMRYADVQRKIRDLRSGFVLRTNQRNGLVVYKSIMTPQEIESVRALLNERCPQKKTAG